MQPVDNSTTYVTHRTVSNLDAGTEAWIGALSNSNDLKKVSFSPVSMGDMPESFHPSGNALDLMQLDSTITTVAKAPVKEHKPVKKSIVRLQRPFVPPTSFPLTELPQEIVERILEWSVTAPHPLNVTPNMDTLPLGTETVVNYSLIHTAKAYYIVGLPMYYQVNIFAIELAGFFDTPTTTNAWAANVVMAAAEIKTVRLTARRHRNWEHSINLLKGFKALEEITFDMRDDMGQYGRVEANPADERAFYQTRKRAGVKITLALEAGGVNLENLGGIWFVEEMNYGEQYLLEKLLEYF